MAGTRTRSLLYALSEVLMKIYLLFDYEDRPIKASCDHLKLEREAEEMNGPEDWGPYFVSCIDLEDAPQQPIVCFRCGVAINNQPDHHNYTECDCLLPGLTVTHKQGCRYYE